MEDYKKQIKEIIKLSNYADALKFGQKICDDANKTTKPFDYIADYFKGTWGIDEGCELVDYDYENMSLTLTINKDRKACVSPSVQFFNITANEDEEDSLYPVFLVDVETGYVSYIEPHDVPSFTLDKAELDEILK